MDEESTPPNVARHDNELVCFGGVSEGSGWSFNVILFRGEPRGEIRFLLHDVPAFTQPIGIQEIAMFQAKREDLIAPYVNGLIKNYKPH